MTAAILSTKTKRFFDLAVGSELFEGQKIKDFQEKKKQLCGIPEWEKTNPSQKLELPYRRNPWLAVNACYPLFGPRSKLHWALCCAKVKWCIRLVFQQMPAELSNHTVALSSRKPSTELMESFRTMGHMAIYLTTLMEGYLHGHKTCMDIFAQLTSIYPVTGEGAFRKATLYPDGCEGMPKAAFCKWPFFSSFTQKMQSDRENSSPKKLLYHLVLQSTSCTVLLVSEIVENYCHIINTSVMG